MSRTKALQAGGEKLSFVFGETLKKIKPGVSLAEVNQKAEDLLNKIGLKPSFKTVRNYQWAACLNINEGVVHGVPNERIITRGDLVSLDMGLIFAGWHVDMAYTVEINPPAGGERLKAKSLEATKFLQAGKMALAQAIKAARAGNYVGDISVAIQTVIEKAGYQVVSKLAGHGVGKSLHELPNVPGVLRGKKEDTPRLEEGMALALEVIYTKGRGGIKVGPDGWTISTQDGKIAALFEKTILVSQSQAEELTPFIWENA